MTSARPSTPPSTATNTAQKQALTPEQIRRVEESRLKAKALRSQREAAQSRNGTGPNNHRTPSGFIVSNDTSSTTGNGSSSVTGSSIAAGQKRPHSAITTKPQPTQRDARNGAPTTTTNGQNGSEGANPAKKSSEVETARKFQSYIDYDFSKMTDTHGGFLSADDDPFNKVLHKPSSDAEKPAHMTVKEWERHQLLRKLRAQKQGPYEPGLNALDERSKAKSCAECGSLELDFQFLEVFDVRVCGQCRDKMPEKYSLLTKTEAKEDYLLTDPELRDPDLLRRLEKPNPHKREWNNMHLFLRFQVEAYAFSERKWGGAEKLDEEFERRQGEKKRRKEEKFRGKLMELKKRTRVEAYRRGRERERNGGEGEARFGDRVGGAEEEHVHEWGRVVVDGEGVGRKSCVGCGMQVEELEF